MADTKTLRFDIDHGSIDDLDRVLTQCVCDLELATAATARPIFVPLPSVLSKCIHELTRTCEALFAMRMYRAAGARVRGGSSHLEPAHRRRCIEVADALLMMLVRGYDLSPTANGDAGGGGADAGISIIQRPVDYQNYCTDEDLIGQSPATMVMLARWYLFFVAYEMHTMSEGDVTGSTWDELNARPLAERRVKDIEDGVLVRAGVSVTARRWSEWRQTDLRLMVEALAQRKERLTTTRGLSTYLTWIEQRMALFMAAGLTGALLDARDSPFGRGDATRFRLAFSGSKDEPLYTLSREFIASIVHTVVELHRVVAIHEAFAPETHLDCATPNGRPYQEQLGVGSNDSPSAAAIEPSMFGDLFGDDEIDAPLDDTGVPRRAVADLLDAETRCGAAQWIEQEVLRLLDKRKFRERLVGTVTHMQLRPGDRHTFARRHNGYVLPRTAMPVLNKNRTVAQVTDTLHVIKKQPIQDLLSRARPTVRAATLLHTFDVMCNQHTLFEWKRHVVLFETDFFLELDHLYEYPTPIIVQHAACYSVLFRTRFHHCDDIVDAIALSTLIIVNVLGSCFRVSPRVHELSFMTTWAAQWREMGRLYARENPFNDNALALTHAFEARVRAAPKHRTWFTRHWSVISQRERRDAMMTGMLPGFEPVELMTAADGDNGDDAAAAAATNGKT